MDAKDERLLPENQSQHLKNGEINMRPWTGVVIRDDLCRGAGRALGAARSVTADVNPARLCSQNAVETNSFHLL